MPTAFVDASCSYSVQNYYFDIKLPNDGSIVPAPNDTEVESFHLCTATQVINLLLDNQFTPYVGDFVRILCLININRPAALSMLDFLERHELRGQWKTPGIIGYLHQMRGGSSVWIPDAMHGNFRSMTLLPLDDVHSIGMNTNRARNSSLSDTGTAVQ